MSTYAIGDLQGCYAELLELLDAINFDESNDRLWFVGDLINRGPRSLECIEFVKALGDKAITVLGNHELHLLAVANQTRKPHKKDTLNEILSAPNATELLYWVRHRPLLVNDTDLNFTLLHAGVPPQWSMAQTIELAKETETLLQSDGASDFFDQMYGDHPDKWSDSLTGYDRHRFIINSFTRARYVTKSGKLNMSEKGAPGTQDASLVPWYANPKRKTRNDRIIFGHWSTVTLGSDADFNIYNVYPLDTGCLWGGELTAMRLEDEQVFNVPSRQVRIFS